MHRKVWEFIYIIQALHERSMLKEGKRGVGFAVGQEPLPSFFANLGCKIVATDLDESDDVAESWKNHAQHASNLQSLYRENLCSKDDFENNVEFRFVNATNIPQDLVDFDFCWSACAFEHFGSIENGKNFIYDMVKCLKPGGIAVHTTEYNLSSNNETIETGYNVLFRKADFEDIVAKLTSQGHYVEPLDFRLDDSVYDHIVAYPPYNLNPYHFKLEFGGYLSTSFGIIVQKAK